MDRYRVYSYYIVARGRQCGQAMKDRPGRDGDGGRRTEPGLEHGPREDDERIHAPVTRRAKRHGLRISAPATSTSTAASTGPKTLVLVFLI